MFIAISDIDHDSILNNCDIERLDYYNYEMENPIFMAMTFERVCECIGRCYHLLDDDFCPDYIIYEINGGSWTVKGARTISINVDRNDA